jgi:hypothetical protein
MKPTGPRSIRVNPLVRKYSQFLALKAEVEDATPKLNNLKKELLQIVQEAKDVDIDDKGSKYLSLEQPLTINGKTYSAMKRERRTTKVFLVEKAEELMTEKGLYDKARVDEFREDILTQVDNFPQPVSVYVDIQLDQDEVYLAYQNDLLTEEEVDSLFEMSETFAFVPIS